MRLKCPQCSTIIEGQPGSRAQCTSCGYAADVPASTPAPGGGPPVTPPPGAPAQQYAPQVQQYAPQAQPGMAPNPAMNAGVMGKPRSFGIGLLLTVVTLGIYMYVWNFLAFREIARQHGRQHEQIWFWLAIGFLLLYIGPVFLWIYQFKHAKMMEQVRQQRAMQPGISAGVFLVLSIFSFLIVTGIIAYYQMTKSMNEVWWQVYQEKGQPWPMAA